LINWAEDVPAVPLALRDTLRVDASSDAFAEALDVAPITTSRTWILDARFGGDGSVRVIGSAITQHAGARAGAGSITFLATFAGGDPVISPLAEMRSEQALAGQSLDYIHVVLVDGGVLHLASSLTQAWFTPVQAGRAMDAQPLEIHGAAPVLRDTGMAMHIPSECHPTFAQGVVAVPLAGDILARAVGLLRVAPEAQHLVWQAWPHADAAPARGLFGVLKRKLRAAEPRAVDLRDIQHSANIEGIEAAAKTPDGIAIYSPGGKPRAKYGDVAASVLHVGATLRATISMDARFRPADDARKHGWRPRVVGDAGKVLLRSSYKSTNPFGGGLRLVDAVTGPRAVLGMPRGFAGGEGWDMSGARVLISKPPGKTARWVFGVCEHAIP